MSTRGRVIVPAWQRSDIYEMDNAPLSDQEDGENSQQGNKSKLNALEFIKRLDTLTCTFIITILSFSFFCIFDFTRARNRMDTFSFSQLLNALVLFEKKKLTVAELVSEVQAFHATFLLIRLFICVKVIRVRNVCKVVDESILVVSSPGLSVYHDFLKYLPSNVRGVLLEKTKGNSSLVPTMDIIPPISSVAVDMSKHPPYFEWGMPVCQSSGTVAGILGSSTSSSPHQYQS